MVDYDYNRTGISIWISIQIPVNICTCINIHMIADAVCWRIHNRKIRTLGKKKIIRRHF